MDLAEHNEAMIREIKQSSAVYVLDNISIPTRQDFLLIENAFLAGASIGMKYARLAEEIK